MQQPETIDHKGIIEKIEDGKIVVRIVKMPACGSCSISGKCPMPDAKEESITIISDNDLNKNVGDEIRVSLKTSMGLRAVLFAYVLPFIVLMAVLLTVHKLSGNEPAAGLAAIVSLLPYYFILYLTRKKLSKKFEFIVTDKK